MVIRDPRRRILARAAATLGALALSASAAAPASAQAPPPPRPSTFVLSAVGRRAALLLNATPGRVVHAAVSVRNLTNHPIAVLLHAADIRNAGNGNAAYATHPLSQSGRWLRLAAGRVRLAPHAHAVVSFAVAVPRGTRGASHYAGIVAVDQADLTLSAARRSGDSSTFHFIRINRQAVPITIRLPGSLTHRLMMRSTRIAVGPAGAALTLGLLPVGTELIEGARVDLRVLHGRRTVFTYHAMLGQLFPTNGLNYRIPWSGSLTPGSYRVVGVIRPQAAAPVHIDRTVTFTVAKAKQLGREAPNAVLSISRTPAWMWPALAVAAIALLLLGGMVATQRNRR